MKSKNLYNFSILLCIISLMSIITSSCTKEKLIIERETIEKIIIQKDTVIKEDTVVNDIILSSSSWQVEEAIGVLGNLALRYQKGGIYNNWNIDGDYYVFNSNHTGYTYDGEGARHEITNWNITNVAGKTSLTFLYVNDTYYNTISRITWDNLLFKNGKLSYNSYYTDSQTGYNYHGQEIRFSKK